MIFLETPVFFCGGSIQSSAWCPMPTVTSPNKTSPASRNQYLAISAFREENRSRSASIGPFESKEVIQIWNCGPLCYSNPVSVAPVLDLGLAHDYGRVWSLAWCPSGCYDDERLGLLAAACSDGTIRLFTIPQPMTLSNASRYVKLFGFLFNFYVDDELFLPLVIHFTKWNPA